MYNILLYLNCDYSFTTVKFRDRVTVCCAIPNINYQIIAIEKIIFNGSGGFNRIFLMRLFLISDKSDTNNYQINCTAACANKFENSNKIIHISHELNTKMKKK